MSSLLCIPPQYAQPEYLPPVGDAPLYDRELRKAAKGLKDNLVTIAYYGWRMRAENCFQSLGYESEDAYRASLEVPHSTWYKYTRIGELLQALSLQDLKDISIGNAELLVQVDPTLRLEHDWVQEAKDRSTGDFAKLVSDRNRSVGGREPVAYYRVRVPFSTKEFLEASVEAYRQENDLASVAQALEFLVADRHDRPTNLSRTTEIRRLVWTTIRLLEKRGIKEITEEMYLLKKAGRLIDEARQEEISQASKAAGNEDGQGRQ